MRRERRGFRARAQADVSARPGRDRRVARHVWHRAQSAVPTIGCLMYPAWEYVCIHTHVGAFRLNGVEVSRQAVTQRRD